MAEFPLVQFAIAGVALICAVVCAKWSMELGMSQFGQVLWGVAGLILGPVAVLMLYVRHLYVAPDSAKRWF